MSLLLMLTLEGNVCTSLGKRDSIAQHDPIVVCRPASPLMRIPGLPRNNLRLCLAEKLTFVYRRLRERGIHASHEESVTRKMSTVLMPNTCTTLQDKGR